MKYLVYGLCCLCLISRAYSMTCYVTVVKASCWLNYDVHVKVLNGTTSGQLVTVDVPKEQQYARQTFPCNAKQELAFQAMFEPAFWDNERGMIYPGKQFIFLPAVEKTTDQAWNVPVCFPDAFSKTPYPPDAKGVCTCDFSVVPPITSQAVKSGNVPMGNQVKGK